MSQADEYCIVELEWVDDSYLQLEVSKESNILAIANAIPSVVQDYDESLESGIRSLFRYLVAAKDIHHWCLTLKQCEGEAWTTGEGYRTDVESPVYRAVKLAVDAYIEHPRFAINNSEYTDEWFNIYWEVVARAINVYDLESLYLDVVVQWLNSWKHSHGEHPYLQYTMHVTLDLVYNGHRNDEFANDFGENQSLLHALRDFVLDSSWLGTDSQWIMERSVLELARYTRYKGTTNYTAVVPVIKSIRDAYENHPQGRSIILRLIAEINYNDAANCHRYGLCDWYEEDGFNDNFRSALFRDNLECPTRPCPDDSITIYAQALAPDHLELACERLASIARVFHSMLDTSCLPVRDDFNDHLEIYVFDDGASCEALESAAFFIDPDSCSGIYWEGDSSDAHTPAQTVMTEYAPDEYPPDPELAIWNFEHEYAHYLDGRYNSHGPYRYEDPSIHWWTEGFAEYLAAETSPYIGLPEFVSTHSLTETLLYSGAIPTSYEQRHLVVRYLIENKREFIDALLALMREGSYSDYTSYMEREAPKYESEWQSWLKAGPSPPGSITPRSHSHDETAEAATGIDAHNSEKTATLSESTPHIQESLEAVQSDIEADDAEQRQPRSRRTLRNLMWALAGVAAGIATLILYMRRRARGSPPPPRHVR